MAPAVGGLSARRDEGGGFASVMERAAGGEGRDGEACGLVEGGGTAGRDRLAEIGRGDRGEMGRFAGREEVEAGTTLLTQIVTQEAKRDPNRSSIVM